LPRLKKSTSGNSLLAVLPQAVLARFLAGCEEVDLAPPEVLFEPGDRLRHAYFPTTAMIALLTATDRSTRLEVGLVGNEGMVGAPLVLGIATSPTQALVQGAGRSLRMGALAFRRELGRSPALRSLLDRYLFVRMTQTAQAVACSRFHLVESRLARLLLMTQDRAHSSTFHMTHEFLASMLGVRRAGVTQAATSLLKRQLIRYSRGDIAVLDRPGLKAAACGCYQTDRDTYSDAFA
jgi:CRP-like cAMP-binding protein